MCVMGSFINNVAAVLVCAVAFISLVKGEWIINAFVWAYRLFKYFLAFIFIFAITLSPAGYHIIGYTWVSFLLDMPNYHSLPPGAPDPYNPNEYKPSVPLTPFFLDHPLYVLKIALSGCSDSDVDLPCGPHLPITEVYCTDYMWEGTKECIALAKADKMVKNRSGRMSAAKIHGRVQP